MYLVFTIAKPPTAADNTHPIELITSYRREATSKYDGEDTAWNNDCIANNAANNKDFMTQGDPRATTDPWKTRTKTKKLIQNCAWLI